MNDFYTNEITEEELDDFKKIYLEDHGRALTDLEALQVATNLLLMTKTVYQKDEVDGPRGGKRK
jgi:hypothetical protein